MTTYKELDQQRASDMFRYNAMHQLQAHSNYGLKELPDSNPNLDQQLAKYISNNYSKMSETEMRNIAARTLTSKEVRARLLQYELYHYQPPSHKMTLEQFVNEAGRLLSRYHHKAGGYCVEDDEWIFHDSTSLDHKLTTNEVLFENSVGKHFINSCKEYVRKLVDRLNSLSTTVYVSYDEVYPDDEIDKDDEKTGLVWMLIRCKHQDENKKEYVPTISL